MERTKCIMVSFGLGGHGEEYIIEGNPYGITKSHLSGYDSPHNWEPREGTDYSEAVFIDKRAVLSKNPQYAYQSPLCGEQDRKLGEIPAGMEVPINNYNVGSLDTLSPRNYEKWWKERGAVTGRFKNGEIKWEAGREKRSGKEEERGR